MSEIRAEITKKALKSGNFEEGDAETNFIPSEGFLILKRDFI